jgi:D-aminopeptidase
MQPNTSPASAKRARARDLGITLGRYPTGPLNAITDVGGVQVGQATLYFGEGPLRVGQGPVRTGVTVILPRPNNVGADPLFAGFHVLNGNGEMTGLPWIAESGLLTTPIAITNTHSVGVVRDALIAYNVAHGNQDQGQAWSMPVVAETWDGFLNDANGLHVHPEHVFAALDAASAALPAEGCVGGGTGMICHGFKGGIGTASRVLPGADGGWTVGVLVQANYGSRLLLRVDGVPVGQEIGPGETPLPWSPPTDTGSIIIVVGTDAPLLPTGCRRLAQRATIGLARMGSVGGNSSGDLFLAFSTANRGLDPAGAAGEPIAVRMLPNEAHTPLFEAVAEAVEEAILNALCMAQTTTGVDGHIAYALPLDRLQAVMRHYRRLA